MQLIDENRKLDHKYWVMNSKLDHRFPNIALGTNGHELMISNEWSKISQEEEPLRE